MPKILLIIFLVSNIKILDYSSLYKLLSISSPFNYNINALYIIMKIYGSILTEI